MSAEGGTELRDQRVAKNEASFRLASGRVEDEVHDFGATELMHFHCECAQDDCRQTIQLTIDEYEEIRTNRGQLAICPGHEQPETEDVVELHDRYAVVLQRDEAA